MARIVKMREVSRFAETLQARAMLATGRARAFAEQWRKPILAVALIAFVVGFAISVREIGLDLATIRPVPLIVLAAVTVPLSIAYSAVNMMLMANAAGVSIGFRGGVTISVIAQASEILPLPGGAIVRAASLVRAGGSTVQSAQLVLLFALLWVATAAVGAGLALAHLGWGAAFLAIGVATWLALFAWLATRFGTRLALVAGGLRLVGVALVAWRLSLAFAAIGLVLAPADCLAFAFAMILGSTAAIVPAGLGVAEGLSALMAGPSGIDPAAAFLAVALNRVLGLALNMMVALAFISLAPSEGAAPAKAKGSVWPSGRYEGD